MKQNSISKLKTLLTAAGLLCLPMFASAHENYVLTKDQINGDLAVKGINVFSALNNPANLRVAISVGIFSLLGVIAYFFFQNSKAGEKFNTQLQKLEPLGHIILRVALAGSLLASAYYNSFLGPEIPLTSLPLGIILKPVLLALGLLLLFGLWSEVVGAISLVVLLLATWVYKDYMVTYFNYFGEFIALIYFGSRTFSLDRLFYKLKASAQKYHDWELLLIRVTYGISVMYPAITYKLIHPEVIIDIVNRYHLNSIHWLFPHDPLLISLGAGLAQVVVGSLLILGFETRLNTLITFALMFMSVLYFKEAVWPHYILLALALYLIINNGGRLSLDNYFKKFKIKAKQYGV